MRTVVNGSLGALLRFLVFVFLASISAICLGNPQVPQGGSNSFNSTGTHSPANGATWDIRNPVGSVIASNSSASGWSVKTSGNSFFVAAPIAAQIWAGYEVRYNNGVQSQGVHSNILSGPISAYFDVVVPAPVLSVVGVFSGQICLSWTFTGSPQYSGSGGPEPTWFNVLRSTTNGGPYTSVGEAAEPQTSFTDNTVTNGTTYYYVVTANEYISTNLYKTSANSNQVSATPYAVPTNLTATPGNAVISLTWNPSQGAATYNVARGTVSGGPYTTIASGLTNTTYLDSSVVNGTTYYYVVYPTEGNGKNGPNSNQASATPYAPPQPPANLVATAGNQQIQLTWNSSATAASYSLYKSTSSPGTFTPLVSGLTKTSYTDSSVIVGVTYYYYATATNCGGESGYSNQASATPYGVPPPPVLSAEAGNQCVYLTWSDTGVTSYTLERSNTNGGPYTPIASNLTGTAYTDNGLTNGTTYYYVVVGVNSYGQTTSNQVSATPVSPPPPPTLTATPGDTKVYLSWTSSTGATSYTLYRSLSSAGPFGPIAYPGPNTTTYTDTGLTDGTTYYYVVTASTYLSESVYSNEVSATPEPAPPAPTNLVATPGLGQVSLTWTGSTAASSYNVLRSLTTGGPYSTIATGLTVTNYVDTNVVDGTTYFYVVTATNAYGTSGYSNEASATPYGMPPPPANLVAVPGDTLVKLSWHPTVWTTTYSVWRSVTNNGTYGLVQANITATTYTDTGLTNGTTYYYVVTATGPGGMSGNSNQAVATPGRFPSGVTTNPLGFLNDPLALPEWEEQATPVDTSDSPGGGPSQAFSISLPFGSVDVDAGPDVVMSDPFVGSIGFGICYRTPLAQGGLSSAGLPAGWYHNWDYHLIALNPGTFGSLQFVYPNGAWETQVPNPGSPGGLPPGTFQPIVGAPYQVTAVPNPYKGDWDSVTISHNGVAKEVYLPNTARTEYLLSQVVLENSSSIQLTYSYGQLTQLQGFDPYGNPSPNQFAVNYNGGQLVSAGYPGNLVQYGYTNGQISTVSNTAASGNLWQFGYTTVAGAQYLSSAQTAMGYQAGISYDPVMGQATTFTDGNGYQRSYSYDLGNGLTYLDVYNKMLAYGWDTSGRLTSFKDTHRTTTTFTYAQTNPGALASIASPGMTTNVTYDSVGNPTQITYPYGNSRTLNWSYLAGYPFGLLTSIQDKGTDGTTKQPTTYTYYYGTNSLGAYAGQVASITYPNGGVYSYTYTPLGDVAKVQTTAANGANAVTQFLYGNNECLGRPIQMIDPLGNYTTYGWDAQGLSSVMDPLGYVTQRSANTYGQVTGLSLPAGEQVSVNYNEQGRPPIGFSVTGNSFPFTFNISPDNEYGAVGGTGSVTPNWTNSLNQQYGLKALTDANSQVMHQFSSNAAANTLEYVFGNGSNSATYKASLDVNQNLSTFAGPISNGTVIRGPGELPSQIGMSQSNSNASSVYQYQYDGFGRVTQSMVTAQGSNSANGYTTQHNYTYDDEDHVLTDTVTIGSYVSNVTYTYAPCGARTSMQVSVPGQPTVLYTYGYDTDNNLTSILVSQNGQAVQGVGATFTYDADNRVKSATTSQAIVAYTYDQEGRETSITNKTLTGGVYSSFTGITYDAWGDRLGANFYIEGQPWSGTPVVSSVSGSVTYNYGLADLAHPYLLGEAWNIPSLGSTTALSYANDPAGNLTTVRGLSLNLDPGSDELTSSTSYPNLSYDADGDILGFRNLSLSYDLADQLLATGAPGSNNWTLMGYDGDGHRVMRQYAAGASDGFVYDGDALVYSSQAAAAWTSGASQAYAFYVWGPTGVIQEFGNLPYGTAGTYLFDMNGSVVTRATNTAYTWDQPHVYDAYGEPVWRQQVEPGDPNSSPDYNSLMFRYKGQYGYFTDTDADVVYCHHRYYDPQAARWLTRDPAGLEGGIDPYEYCEGNPLTDVDLSGLDACAVLVSQIPRLTVVEGGASEVAAQSVLKCIPGVGWVVMAATGGWAIGRTIDNHFGLSDEVLAEESGANALSDEMAADPDYGELKRLWWNATDGQKAELESQYAFLQQYARVNRKRLTSWVGHHLLPQAFIEKFKAAGFTGKDSINNRKYIVPMRWADHEYVHGKGGGLAFANSWNKQWEAFFDRKPNAKKAEILMFMNQLRRRYRL